MVTSETKDVFTSTYIVPYGGKKYKVTFTNEALRNIARNAVACSVLFYEGGGITVSSVKED